MVAWFISDVTLQGPDARELIRQTHSIQNVPLTSHSSHTEICSQVIRIFMHIKQHYLHNVHSLCIKTVFIYLKVYLFI